MDVFQNKAIIISENRNFKQALSHKAMIYWNGNTDKIDNGETTLLVYSILVFATREKTMVQFHTISVVWKQELIASMYKDEY